MKSNTAGRNQRGFTIVEFMIATAVFSMVLLVVTAAILYMSRSYQKSVYASNTQAATRNLVDTLSQAIKFSSDQIIMTSDTATNPGRICAGNRQFLYEVGRQLDGSSAGTSTRNAIVTRLDATGTCPLENITTALSATGSPKELLGKGMRLVKLRIDDTNPPMFTVIARVAYGDDDLLCSPSVANSCDQGAATLTFTDLSTRGDLICRPGRGAEFCHVSELSTTVYRRL